MSGKIEVTRLKQRFAAGGLLPLAIYVDGNEVGEIRSGESKEISVANGIHSIHVGQSHLVSNSIAVHVNDDGKHVFEAGTWLYGWKILLSIFYILSLGGLFYLRKITDEQI